MQICMTPPFVLRAWSISSVRFLGLEQSERQDECEAITGALEALMTSKNDLSEICETSTIMPSRFISFTTSAPNAESPLFSGPDGSVDESQISLLAEWHSVKYR